MSAGNVAAGKRWLAGERPECAGLARASPCVRVETRLGLEGVGDVGIARRESPGGVRGCGARSQAGAAGACACAAGAFPAPRAGAPRWLLLLLLRGAGVSGVRARGVSG